MTGDADCVMVQPFSQQPHGSLVLLRWTSLRYASRCTPIEHRHRVGLERGRHRGPERGRVIGVGHGLLHGGREGPGRVPVHVEDDEEPVRVQLVGVGDDLGLVVTARIGRIHPVDPEPAVFVEWKTDGVDVAPREHPGRDGVRVGAAGEEPVSAAAYARVLTAWR